MADKKERQESNLISAIHDCHTIINDSNDINSLYSQLADLAYKDAIYRTFNEGLRLDKNNENRPKMIIDLMHELFFKNQALNVRKLFDQDKDVHSLRRIFDIVNANRAIYTRKGYLLANNAQIERLNHPEMKKGQIEYLNKLYDSVSAKKSNARCDDDPLKLDYLDKIERYLRKRTILNEYTNSFVTHSIKSKKRKIKETKLQKISLAELQRTYKKISWLSYLLSRYIGELILFEVPSVSFDIFEGWSGTIYSKKIDRSLNTFWHKRANIYRTWQGKYWDLSKLYLTPNGKAIEINT